MRIMNQRELSCFRLVSDVTYDQECDNIVQHVCEEVYHVPVPLPAPVTPEPIFSARIPRSSSSPRFRSSSSRARPSQPPLFRRKRRQSDDDISNKLLTDLQNAVKAPSPTLLSHQVHLVIQVFEIILKNISGAARSPGMSHCGDSVLSQDPSSDPEKVA